MRSRRVRGRLVGDKPAGVHVGQVRAEGRGQIELPSTRSPPEPQQDQARAIDSMAGQIARCAAKGWLHIVSAVFWM
jgi:hypothetical protein